MATTNNDDEAHRLNVKDLLFFPGKELRETIIAGRRTPPRPIRLAIGKHGMYKFEPEEDKVLAFWSFSQIKDWNFSGYSFTLTFTSNNDYYIRTDEGPTISQWLESFTKNPLQAEVAAKQFKSLESMESSGELRTFNNEPKFYTLNTRKSKGMGSRVLQAYGVDKKQSGTGSHTLRHSRKGDNKKSDPQRWSSIDNNLNDKKETPSKSDGLTRSIDSLVNSTSHAAIGDKRSQSSPHRPTPIPTG